MQYTNPNRRFSRIFLFEKVLSVSKHYLFSMSGSKIKNGIRETNLKAKNKLMPKGRI